MICPKCDYKKIFDFTICPRCGYNLNEIAEKREILSRGNSVLKSEISSSPANTIQSNNNLELAEKYKKKMIFLRNTQNNDGITPKTICLFRTQKQI